MPSYCSVENIYVFFADFRQVINTFLSLCVIFQYVIKGADPCALTNCSPNEMPDEILPNQRKRVRERGKGGSLCSFIMGNRARTSGF